MANEEIGATASELSDLVLLLGSEVDEQISHGYIAFQRDRNKEQMASHMKAILKHTGSLERIQVGISFFTQQSGASIYGHMESVISFFWKV